MKKRNPFLIVIISIVVILLVFFLFAIIQKEKQEELKPVKNDQVERVENRINNSSFEKEFSRQDWQIFIDQNNKYGFDKIISKEGEYSFSIDNQNGAGDSSFIMQRISNIEIDKKISLLGYIKTEECDSARFELELFADDSLLVIGYSESVKGTTDWTEYNCWLKTTLPGSYKNKNIYVDVKAVLYGNGRVWFDNVRLYSIPVDESIYNFDFDRILE